MMNEGRGIAYFRDGLSGRENVETGPPSGSAFLIENKHRA